MKDVDMGWLPWVGPILPQSGTRITKIREKGVKTGDDTRKAEGGREVTASFEDGRGHEECGQLLGATNSGKWTLLWELSPVHPLSMR